MKYYIDNITTEIHAFAKDGSQDEFIPANLEFIAERDALTLIAAKQSKLEASPEVVLAKRSALLSASDWTQMPDSPLTAAKKTAWATYRQALRDLTSQPGYPTTITWPVQP